MTRTTTGLPTLFNERFGNPPTHVAWAPGRVNLVGDHIDYHNLAVLPIALTRGVRLTFRPRDDLRVRLATADPSYPPLTFEAGPAPEPGPAGHWGNYVKASVATLARWGGDRVRGFDAFVESDLPSAAGLSSSSALVVASARAALVAMVPSAEAPPPSDPELAQLLAEGERYVGTAGGGMDQATSLGGVAGSVLLVDFAPVRWQAVPLPADWAVIVAHSGIRAEKSGGAQAAYNSLRSRGQDALGRVAGALGLSGTYAAVRQGAGSDEIALAVERVLEPSLAAVFDHVMSEADRVAAAWRALARADLVAFGAIMDASHASLTDRCGVGHPRLDELVTAARKAGAVGARLTGAGFGGCTVAVVGRHRAGDVLHALSRSNARAGLSPDEAPVFRATPGGGARVTPL